MPFWKEQDEPSDDTEHHCHAFGCKVYVPPKMAMCKKHWYMVPKEIRDMVWLNYRPGQEIDKNPSQKYVYWMLTAVLAVMNREGREKTPAYNTRLKLAERIKHEEHI